MVVGVEGSVSAVTVNETILKIPNMPQALAVYAAQNCIHTPSQLLYTKHLEYCLAHSMCPTNAHSKSCYHEIIPTTL